MGAKQTPISYTTGEVARLCHVTRRTVIQWIDSGKLKGYTLPGSRHRRVQAESLRTFLKDHGLPDIPDAARRRILIVDDDPDLLELLRDALRERYDVDTAPTALGAASRLPVFRPDLILLDIRLPDLSGLEVCRHFRGHRDARRVPILTMSAYGAEVDPADVRRSGADGFLAKPLRLSELQNRIEAMLS